ncbi:MAG: hypothetical protein AAF191_03470 [Verrucomicrobiota bacterium]
MKTSRYLVLALALVSFTLGSCARRQAPAAPTVPDYVEYGK